MKHGGPLGGLSAHLAGSKVTSHELEAWIQSHLDDWHSSKCLDNAEEVEAVSNDLAEAMLAKFSVNW